MDRVTEKLKLARGVVERANKSLELEADSLIAREEQFEARKTEAFAPHYALLDSRHREMDQLEDALKIVSNGDPLESSSDDSEKPKETVAPPPAAPPPEPPPPNPEPPQAAQSAIKAAPMEFHG